MPHVLHLVLDPERARAREVIAQQARDPDLTLSVVLGEGVSWPDAPPVRLLRLDAGPGQPTSPENLDYPHLLRLIFEADSVVTW